MFAENISVHIGRGNAIVFGKSAPEPRCVEGSSGPNHSLGWEAGPFPCRISQSIHWVRGYQEDAAWILEANVTNEVVQYRSCLAQSFCSRLLARLAYPSGEYNFNRGSGHHQRIRWGGANEPGADNLHARDYLRVKDGSKCSGQEIRECASALVSSRLPAPS